MTVNTALFFFIIIVQHVRSQMEERQQLLSIIVESKQKFELLSEVYRRKDVDMDFLSRPRENSELYALVSDSNIPVITEVLRNLNLTYANRTDLLQKFSQRHRNTLSSRQENEVTLESTQTFNYSAYHTLDEIHAYLKHVHRTFPEKTELVHIGQSFEGRDIVAIRIGTDKSKPIIWIDAGIHAREWIAPSTAVYFIKQLLNEGHLNRATNPIDQYNFYILPVLNPDGYEYSWTTNRLWRKSRSTHNCTFTSCCRGVDLDRNFLFDFMDNYNPCRSDYSGPSPLSEPETKALNSFLKSSLCNSDIVLYISMHSFGQYLLTPFGARSEEHVNYWPALALGRHFIERTSINEQHYFLTKTFDIEIKPGQAIDHAMNVLDIPFAFSILLRPLDDAPFSFDLPEEQIIPTAIESFEGLLGMVKVLETYLAKV